MKKHFITYGTNKYFDLKFRLKDQVEKIDVSDTITLYDDTKLSDDFKKKYNEILKHEHGGGYWIWKFDIILNKLEEINDGEFLIYVDSGCTVNANGTKRLEEYVEMIKNRQKG